MIRSIFILTTKGDIIIEKHWRGYLNRNIVDQFMDEASKHDDPKDVPPVVVTSKYYLISVHVADLFFLSPVQGEVPPLLVIEFLQRVVDVFRDYFHNVTEDDLKNNFVSVYMLLEEMMDSGLPFTTEPNILKEVVNPPSLINWPRKGKGPELPEEVNSSVPWRKPVKYANNEIFFDIIEEIDAILDPNGMIINSSISGRVEVQCKLSGMPDLTLRWGNPRLIEDASLHPCVRYNRYEQDKVLSFIPPDGSFTLMKYRIFQQIQPPLYCKPTITFHETGAKLNIMVGPKALPTGKIIEDVVVLVPFPKSVSTVSLEATVGSFTFDDMSKTVRWSMSKIPKDKTPMLSGSVSLTPGCPPPECNPVLSLEFRVQMFSGSGLKVDSLALHNESYRPYKGVRSITKGGIFQIRS